MSASSQPSSPTSRILVMSTYVPRECGIATYAEDVIQAVEPHGATCDVLAMERPDEHYRYEPRVIGTVQDNDPASCRRAAELVNAGGYDVLSLQHEFGIYGGEVAEYLLPFLEAVRIPIVVTFHTMVSEPSPGMKRVQQAIGRRAQRIVVMNGLAPALLQRVYDIDPNTVHVIHHGAPVPHCGRRICRRDDLMPADDEIITTFGLISPVKGLEFMVKAMPDIVAERPNAVYYILGQTHPVFKRQQGEWYRGSLENLAMELGVQRHVRFIDRYLLKRELVEYLLSTDLYVTPYLNLEQVTSGTLAYAIGSGCPVVSTPYLHAQYLLQEGRGVLVPSDPQALAEAAINILSDAPLRRRMEQANWEYGQTLYWPRVGAEYLGVFQSAAKST